MKSNVRLLCVAWVFVGSVGAFDLPNKYRTPFFQTDVTQKTKNWTTQLGARFATGDTHHAYSAHERTTALFNANGPFDVTRLGFDLEDITPGSETDNFWGEGGFWSRDNVADDAGLVEFGGRFKTTEIDFELTQNLFWGLYAHVYVPYKDVHLHAITAKNVGPTAVNNQDIDAFVTDSLPTILTENGFTQPLTEPFKRHDIGDVAVSVGWHKYKDGLSGPIKTLGGFLQIGASLPTAPRIDQNIVFSVPLGYDKHLGIVTRLGGQATLLKIVTVGVQAGSIIFFKENRTMRMITDKKQNGLIVLERGAAHVDLGSLWDLGAYVKADQFLKGFAAIVGCSFTRQERTILEVRDDHFLKTAREAAATPDADRVIPGFISADDVVNADKRLSAWETYALHVIAEYDAGSVLKTTWAPFVRVEYDCSLWGKQSWLADMVSGSIGLSVAWNF